MVATATAPKKSVEPIPEKSVVDIVSEKVSDFLKAGQLDLPKNYSWDNALKSAYLALNTVKNKEDKLVMEDGRLTGIVTKASVANAVLDMIVQGLNPGKKQCYFVVYGKALTCQRSYFGSMAVAEMVNPVIKDWGYEVIYEGDTFKYGILNGKKRVIEHVQTFDNIDKVKIVGAYAMALDAKGDPIKTEIMTIDEIHQSWEMSKSKPFAENGEVKASSVHGKFARDMALRTVINKVCKFIINHSSDNALLLDRINRAEELADVAAVQAEIEDKANKGGLIMIPSEPEKLPEPGQVVDAEFPTKEPEKPAANGNGKGPDF